MSLDTEAVAAFRPAASPVDGGRAGLVLCEEALWALGGGGVLRAPALGLREAQGQKGERP